MLVSERNKKAKEIVNTHITAARKLEYGHFSDLDDYVEVTNLLTDLIYVKANGFRGIVLTAIVGLELNPDYDPLNNFYGCNPRSIFEQGIWYALTENSVPCGKSDPLNVAKNINELNEAWAQGKRPQSAAIAAVKYLRIVTRETDLARRTKLIQYFFFRLTNYAESIGKITISSFETDRHSTTWFGKRVSDFVLKFPESGTIPQLVVGHLIAAIYESSSIKVEGFTESVFGTNTTSKKPADIWLTKDESETVLYEVTVKKIDKKRLDDCLESIVTMKLEAKPVRFICRIPDDVTGLELDENNEYNYKGKTFEFIDIKNFIESCVALLSESQLDQVMEKIRSFVTDVNRPVKTKEGWNSIFEES